MTKTQYYTATSVDGFIADPDNSLDWLFQVAGGDDGKNDRFTTFFAQVGAMVMGATTYQWVLDHEKLLDNPDKWRSFYGELPCWVLTHRQLPAIPGAHLSFVEGDVGPVHAEMVRAAAGKNIWLIGGGDLVGQFADQGLLDEILLGVAPVLLGAGAPLLPRRLLASDLTLTDVERHGQFAFLTYQVRANG
ncbi:MAG TPA: dihydrofolate reductase family protein [Micromonosporaceae bacterium]|nr:dihydrofolate reductase family protein [Micromonosporaceae bacterium]